MYLAVGGFMGTGKTTLSRALARRFGWTRVPSRRVAATFLEDLFRDADRWAFEAQVAFLVEKATEARSLLAAGGHIILDRSLSEDVQVFARYFLNRGHLDSRAAEIYDELSNYLQREMGPPQVMFLCECPFELASERIKSRNAPHARYYPAGHLEEIAELYRSWIEACEYDRIVSVDTARLDTRAPDVLNAILEDVDALFRASSLQRSLFDLSSREPNLRVLRNIRWRPTLEEPMPAPRLVAPARPYPSAYIAAPFSGVAQTSREDSLFGSLAPHGVIRRGPYQSFLLNIERALRRLGVTSILPHRDVNKWGRKRLAANEAARLCTMHVEASDIFVGVLGASAGAHYECGIAMGLGKPIILIRSKQFGDSFIASGIDERMSNVISVEIGSWKDITGALVQPRVVSFLNRYVPVGEVK